MKKPAKSTLTTLIEKHRGNLAAVGRSCGVARVTVWKWVQQDEELKATVENARESFLDDVESTLYQKALEGDTTCMIFVLKTQGRNRGYGNQPAQPEQPAQPQAQQQQALVPPPLTREEWEKRYGNPYQ